MSGVGARGLRIDLFNNPIVNDNFVFGLGDYGEFTQAHFATAALGGFAEGGFTIANLPRAWQDTALNTWLTKRIRITDGGGFVAYEGYISDVTVKRGGHTKTRSVDDLSNHVLMTGTIPDALHVGSTLTYTTFSNNTASQNQYGIWEKRFDISSQGTLLQTQLQAAGDYMLTRLQQSIKKNQDEIGALLPDQSVELGTRGFFSTLSARSSSLNYPTATEIATIVKAMLALTQNIGIGANVNVCQFIDRTDTANIATTGRTIKINANKDQYLVVQDFLKQCLEYGDSAGLRLLLQVWSDRKLYLRARSTTLAYHTRSNSWKVWDRSQAAVPGYRVRAGDYMVEDDDNAATDNLTDVDSDPRATLIESTDYDLLNDKLTTTPADQANVNLMLGRVVSGNRNHLIIV